MKLIKKVILQGGGYSILVGSVSLVDWELGIGTAALIGMLHGMGWILKRNAEIVSIEKSSSTARKKTVTIQAQKQPISRPSSTKKSNKDIAAIAGLDENIFNQFQNNLNRASAEKSGIAALDALVKGAAANSLNKPPLKEKQKIESTQVEKDVLDPYLHEQTTDKVIIRNKPQKQSLPLTNHKTSATVKKTEAVPPQKADKEAQYLLKKLADSIEPDDDDLFADIQIPLAGAVVDDLENSSQGTNIHVLFDEGLERVLHSSLSSDEKGTEAAALWKIAEKAYHSGQWEEARASLDNYFTLIKELHQKPDWKIQLLYIRLCLKQGDFKDAGVYLTQLRESGFDGQHPEFAKVMEELAAGLEGQLAFQEALPLLNELLNYYRQQLDRLGMDNAYERMERALEVLGDDEKLIRAYKNHLEIKRILKDQYGESRLLDLIGNRYYKMGEKELSREYYENNLRLKAVMEKAESA